MRFLKMYKVEQRLFFRTPDVIIFNLAMPLVALILITIITGDKDAADSGLTFLQSSYVALSTVGICCSAFMSILISIGLMVASLCRSTKSMNVVTSLIYFPMLLFSGATIPAEVFPRGLRAIADVMPLGVGINLLKSVSMGCYDKIMIPVIILLSIAVICGTVAIKTFRWE